MVEHFIQQNPEFHKSFSPEALKVLERYPWPGNVRELKNIVHRTLLLTEQEVIEPPALPPNLMTRLAMERPRPVLPPFALVVKEGIENSLKHGRGNSWARAADTDADSFFIPACL